MLPIEKRRGVLFAHGLVVSTRDTGEASCRGWSSRENSNSMRTGHLGPVSHKRDVVCAGTGTDTGEGVIRRSSAADSMTEVGRLTKQGARPCMSVMARKF